MSSANTIFWLPTPIFWGTVAAWIPIPPSILVGIFCSIMVYALLLFLFSLREWDRAEKPSEEESLIPTKIQSEAVI